MRAMTLVPPVMVMTMALATPVSIAQWPQAAPAPYPQYPAPGYGYPMPAHGYPAAQPMPYHPQMNYPPPMMAPPQQPMYMANRYAGQPYPQPAWQYPQPAPYAQPYPPTAWQQPHTSYAMHQPAPVPGQPLPFNIQSMNPMLGQKELAINAEAKEDAVVAGPKSNLPNCSEPLKLTERTQNTRNQWFRSLFSSATNRLSAREERKNLSELEKATK